MELYSGACIQGRRLPFTGGAERVSTAHGGEAGLRNYAEAAVPT